MNGGEGGGVACLLRNPNHHQGISFLVSNNGEWVIKANCTDGIVILETGALLVERPSF